jgi:hypothetical protein
LGGQYGGSSIGDASATFQLRAFLTPAAMAKGESPADAAA